LLLLLLLLLFRRVDQSVKPSQHIFLNTLHSSAEITLSQQRSTPAHSIDRRFERVLCLLLSQDPLEIARSVARTFLR
jgi:hypothetical protein